MDIQHSHICDMCNDIQRDLSIVIKNLHEAFPEKEVKEYQCNLVYSAKPAWAIHGCHGPSRKNKGIVFPQFPSSQRPKKWGHTIRNNENGYSCIHPRCHDYDKIYPTKSAAQQHSKKHYPAEYICEDCNGSWHLKTEYNYHFLLPCPHCNKLIMKTSMSSHIKICQG